MPHDGDSDRLWPNCPSYIRYHFLSGEELQKQKVRESVVDWTHYANVAFHEESDPSRADVRIAFDLDGDSWSSIGLDCRDVAAPNPTMNIAWVDKSNDLSRAEKAVVLRQFGCVLGLSPEVYPLVAGGDAILKQQGCSDQQIDEYKKSSVANYARWDEHSIMHLPQPKELTGLDHDIRYNCDLSELDKAYMTLRYPRPTPHHQALEWTFEHALDLVGCPLSVKNSIQDAKKAGTDSTGNIDPTKIRGILGNWARAERTPRPVTISANLARIVPGEARLRNACNGLNSSVGGPNSHSLSSNYSEILANLIPKDDAATTREQREKMRAWLLEPTENDN